MQIEVIEYLAKAKEFDRSITLNLLTAVLFKSPEQVQLIFAFQNSNKRTFRNTIKYKN